MDSYRIYVKFDDTMPITYDMVLFRFCAELMPFLNWLTAYGQELVRRYSQAAVDAAHACAGDPVACGNYFNRLYHQLELPAVPSLEVLEVITPQIESDLQHGLIPGPQQNA